MGARQALYKIFKQGYPYAKAGILLSHFSNPSMIQKSFFDGVHESKYMHIKQDNHLMQCVDEMNKEKTQIYYASQRPNQLSPIQKKMISPKYTTNWWELPTAN
jgi:DNA polymerase V